MSDEINNIDGLFKKLVENPQHEKPLRGSQFLAQETVFILIFMNFL